MFVQRKQKKREVGRFGILGVSIFVRRFQQCNLTITQQLHSSNSYLLCKHVFGESYGLSAAALEIPVLCLLISFISAVSDLQPFCPWTCAGVVDCTLVPNLFLAQCCLALACNCNIKHFSFFSIDVDFGLMSDSSRQQYHCVFMAIKPTYLPHQNRGTLSPSLLGK